MTTETEKSQFAPIALFVYKRPDAVRAVLQNLARLDGIGNTELFIFSDGPKNEADRPAVEAVRSVCRDFHAGKSVHVAESPVNRGLSGSILGGIEQIFQNFDRVIVLEDDMLAGKYFLQFMNDALTRMQTDERIFQVHAFAPPHSRAPESCFLRPGADCWGWGSTRKAWQETFSPDAAQLLRQIEERSLQYQFDVEGTFPYTKMLRDTADGRLDSWAIRAYASAFLAGKYTLQSNVPLISNVGFGNGATHQWQGKRSGFLPSDSLPVIPPEIPYESELLRSEYRSYLKSLKIPLAWRIRFKLKLIWKKIFS